MPFIVVLADPDDRGALLIVRALRRRGAPVVLVSTNQLLLAPVWVHDPLGASRIVLGNGLELTDRSIGVVFCRIRGVDPPQFLRASARDRIYAQGEFFALIMSWLARLGERVHNRPHPGNLHGIRCSLLEDMLKSAQCSITPHGFAAASHARQLPQRGGPIGDYRPWYSHLDAEPADGSSMPGSALAGGPGMRLPTLADGRFWNVALIGDRVIGAELPAAAQSLAIRLAHERELTFAAVEIFELADGSFGHGTVDPLPPLDHEAQVNAAADLLTRALSQGVR